MGAMVVAYAIQFAASVVPLLGYLAPIFLGGPLMGGMLVVYLKRLRGQPAEVGGVFGGFYPRYWQLVLVQFIQTVLVWVVLIPVMAVAMIPVMLSVVRAGQTNTAPQFATWMFAAFGGLMLVAAPFVIYFMVAWGFSLMLVADKGLDFWPAMGLSRKVVQKHWWRVFGLFVVTLLLMFAGTLLCLVGALFTGPIAIAMFCYLYEVAEDVLVEAGRM